MNPIEKVLDRQLPPAARPGLVSVVLVAGSSADPGAVLGQLSGLHWPADRMEVVLVLAPGVEFVAQPGVRTVVLDEVATLAAARNAGAAVASGELLAFLAPGVTPNPEWLVHSLGTLRDDARVAAVASRVDDTLGRACFSGATMSFAGQAGHPHAGEPSDAVPDLEADVLFPADEAFVIDAGAFRWVNGFDAEFAVGVECPDLGWRLWLHGFRVRYDPRSRVVTSATDGVDDPECGLFGELCMIYKNYDDAHLHSTLAAAILRGGNRRGGTEDIDRFTSALPQLGEARRKIQASRVTADAEVVQHFVAPFASVTESDQAVLDALGAQQVFSHRRRIAIVTPDVLKAQMAGPAIRAWQIALALSREHDVQLATTVRCELTHPAFPVSHVDDAGLHALEQWCDVLVFQGHIMESHPWLERSKKILVVDIYDPFHLEVLEQARDAPDHDRRRSVRMAVEVLNDQIARGDFFLCASEKQRDFWLGQFAAVGRINPAVYDGGENLEKLLTVVPFGVSDDPPRRTRTALKGVVPGIGPDDHVILWGGGVYNWLDPLTLVRAVDKLRERLPTVRLFFMGLKHPNPDVPAMQMAYETRKLAKELDLVDTHVFFNEGWVEYQDRENYLLESDLGVSTHLDHVETAFSFRTRILDYLWASLPIVATSGDSFAEIIDARGLGITVPAGDVDALEDALFTLLSDDARREQCRTAIAGCVDEFRWNRVLSPIIEFCRDPRHAPDRVDPRQRGFIGDLRAQQMWGRQGWRHRARVVLDHVRRREYEDLSRKVRIRVRTLLFPESDGPAARRL